jgi:hypothetical protein
VALVAVIAVTAVVSISIAGGGDSSPVAVSGDADSEFASANDTGPVNIITEDPTCAAWMPINDTLARVQRNGWDRRDPTLPVKEWTSEQRAQYKEVGQAMRAAADQTVPLAKLTPHRVMRELYGVFISYARQYDDALSSYSENDNYLAAVVVGTSSALTNICAAVQYNSAAARELLVPRTADPSIVIEPTEVANIRIVAEAVGATCAKWNAKLETFIASTKEWQALDPNLPASAWTAEERDVVDRVIPTMNEFADEAEEIGRNSDNIVFEDLAVLVAQYRRAYAAGLPTYTPADYYLARASSRAASVLFDVCKAAGG